MLPIPLQAYYFHTIKSILNRPILQSSTFMHQYFHTIKSILNNNEIHFIAARTNNFHTIKSILNEFILEKIGVTGA